MLGSVGRSFRGPSFGIVQHLNHVLQALLVPAQPDGLLLLQLHPLGRALQVGLNPRSGSGADGWKPLQLGTH